MNRKKPSVLLGFFNMISDGDDGGDVLRRIENVHGRLARDKARLLLPIQA